MFCRVPYNGMLIQPDGRLSMCCAQTAMYDYGHISTTPDLKKAWEEHPNAVKIREVDFDLTEFACGRCVKESKFLVNRWVQVNEKSNYVNIPIDGKIRFLEFTTSNICNQTCASCSSFFSSKWRTLEQEALELNLPLDEWKNGDGFNSFGKENYRLSDSDIEKIFPLLPDLHTIYVKGGEPFADNNNYEVLKELIKVNPTCNIQISSNMSKVPEKYLSLLSGKRVAISCSMDGINETYEYTRSTKFENTIENIKRWKAAKIDGRLDISITMSLYNMYNINETLDYWKNNMIDEVTGVYPRRWIMQPFFISPTFVLTQEQIDDYYNNYLNDHDSSLNKNLYSLKSAEVSKEYRQKQIKRFHAYTKFMNYKRGINIYDIHPKLRDI